MNIIIATDIDLPYGSAGASRIRNLARGLSDVEQSMLILLLNPLRSDRGEETSYKGVPVESVYVNRPSRHRSRSNSKIAWYVELFQKAYLGKKRLAEIIKKGSVDALIVYSWNGIVLGPMIRLAHAQKVPVIVDVVEWPTSHSFRWGVINPLFWSNSYYKELTYSRAAGAIAISTLIEQILVDNHKRVLRVPALVEPDLYAPFRNHQIIGPSGDCSEVSYVGTLTPKNDPDALIELAFALENAHIAFRLNIIGSPSSDRMNRYFEKLAEGGSKEHVKFWGKLQDDQLRRLLITSDVLVLPRVDDFSNRASFPTRLPELLLSGRPVVTSAVGDIPQYLEDGVHAMLPPPGNPRDFAQRVQSLLLSKTMRDNMGKSGMDRALEAFNYKVHAPRVRQFISSF